MITHRAAAESRNFAFEAYGSSEADARAALERALEAHARQFAPRVDPSWVAEMVADANVYPIACGAGYRDGSRLS